MPRARLHSVRFTSLLLAAACAGPQAHAQFDRIKALASRVGAAQPQATLPAAPATAPPEAGPRKPGTVRIGLLMPRNGLGQTGDPAAGEPVREAEARLLTGPSFEPVKLTAMLPDQALAEARQLGCDYVLSSELTQTPVPATGRFGKLMNMKNAALASQAAMFIPGISSAAMMTSVLSTMAMQQTMAEATRGVKANNNITLAYTLTAINGTVALTDTARTVSKSSGEDVLPPLLTEEATKVLAAAKPVPGAPVGTGTGTDVAPAAGATPAVSTGAAPAVIRAYAAYDFIPAEKIVFADDFTSTQDGEFPAGWEVLKGQGAVNQQAGSAAFVLTDGVFAKMRPRLSMASLGTQWTLEFDTYGIADAGKPTLFFNLDKNSDNPSLTLESFRAQYFFSHGDDGVNLEGRFPEDIALKNYVGRWHHVAIAYRAPQMKVYVDQYRVLYVPDLKFAPQALTLGGEATPVRPIVMRNVRIAAGAGMNLVGSKFTAGKLVTHGINFDTDQATLKPESMGTLNQIKKILDGDPALKFEIDGHTDSTGAAAHNKELSEQRAAAVKSQLVAMGVDGSRLTTRGFGDTKPLGPNASAEGKANNRRVEFVRL